MYVCTFRQENYYSRLRHNLFVNIVAILRTSN